MKPDELHNATFRAARMSGYDMQQVDAFIEEMADGIEEYRMEIVQLQSEVDWLCSLKQNKYK